jgi:surface antigen
MKIWSAIAMAVFLYSPCGPVLADSDKDENGHGHRRHGHYEGKEEYWDGDCKVERKWKKNGDYKEERKCKGHGYGHHHDNPPPPQVVVVLPPWLVNESTGPEYRPGWEPEPPPSSTDESIFHCNSAQVGSVLGGILGGVIGHQFGKGSGRTAATIGGTIAGVFIGGEIGRQMDAQNQACVAQALEFAPPGERIAWQAPDSRTQYAVVPGQFEKHGDTYCRSFTTEVKGSDDPGQTTSKACRRADGVWVGAR